MIDPQEKARTQGKCRAIKSHTGTFSIREFIYSILRRFLYFYMSNPLIYTILGALVSPVPDCVFQAFSIGKVLVTQSCPMLRNSMDCSPPGSSVHGILQAKTLEWVAISFSGDCPNPGVRPGSPAFQEDSLLSEPPGNIPAGKGAFYCLKVIIYRGCGQQIFNSYSFYVLNILEKEGANPPERVYSLAWKIGK